MKEKIKRMSNIVAKDLSFSKKVIFACSNNVRKEDENLPGVFNV